MLRRSTNVTSNLKSEGYRYRSVLVDIAVTCDALADLCRGDIFEIKVTADQIDQMSFASLRYWSLLLPDR